MQLQFIYGVLILCMLLCQVSHTQTLQIMVVGHRIG